MPFTAATMFNWRFCVALMLLVKVKKEAVRDELQADASLLIWGETVEQVPSRGEGDREMKSYRSSRACLIHLQLEATNIESCLAVK